MRRKRIIIIVIVAFLLAGIFIGFGIHFNNISKPQYIFKSGISIISDNFKNYFNLEDRGIGDNFTIESSIDYNLDSEYYKRTSQSDTEDLKTYNLINNLTNMTDSFVYKQSKKDKTAYIELNEKIKNEEVVDKKVYISNATKYYYVNGILKNYVNDGTCNYFETLTEDNTTKSNIDYLYDFIVESIGNNIKNEYFKEYTVEESINGTKKSVHQISLEVDDYLIHKVLNGVLSDLKKDKKANYILSNIDTTFSKYKIKDSKKFLDKNEVYTINIYTTKVLCKPLKYEIIYLDKDVKKKYIYEGNSSKGTYYYVEDDNVKYTADVSIKENNISAKIYDSKSKNIGELKVEKTGINRTFDFVFDNGEKKWDIVYYSKYSKIKNGSYTNEKKASFKYVLNKESKLNGDVTITTKVSKDVKIEEDVSNAILESKLTDEQKNLFDTKKDKVKERFERK